MLIGLLSDTHGELPAAVLDALTGVERIVHAGDVGGQWILDELGLIAPVVAVRGNMDTGELGWRLPERANVSVGDSRLLVVHKLDELGAAGVPEGVGVVVHGHTHRSTIRWGGDILYVNPGSAGGHNRDGCGPTVALLELTARGAEARIVEL